MRTKNLFKVLFVIAMTLVAVNSFSQNPTSGAYTMGTLVDSTNLDANEHTEYVTVNSRMPYSIVPDNRFWNFIGDGVFNASGFLWMVSDQPIDWTTPANTAAANYALTDTTSGALNDDTNTADANYYLDSTVMIEWKTVGSYAVLSKEKSNSATSGINGCEGELSSLNVEVVAMPTIAWSDAGDLVAGGCGVDGTTINVEVDVTGTDLWKVPVTATYKGLTGAAAVYNPASVFDTPISVGVSDLFADGTTNADANQVLYALNIGAGVYGIWEFTIGGISDRISRKSLGRVAGFGAVAGTEYPATTYRVISLPTPTKKAIKHVTNLGWN